MGKRAGRKRKLVRRQPNGQPYREPDAPKRTVIEARQRLYGLSKEDADGQLSGYALGRMCLAGDFGPNYGRILDASADYCQIVADFMRIKWPTMPIPRAMDYLAGRGMSLYAGPSLKTVERIETRYWRALKALSRPGMSSFDRVGFHELVFHDHAYGKNLVQSVENCVKALSSR